MTEGRSRPAWAEIDLSAIRHNAALIREVAGPAALCAVVKADGYGHGAVSVAGAALAAGADSLAVALVDEGMELRDAGITAPILLLSEPPRDAIDLVIRYGLTPTLASTDPVAGLARAAADMDRSVAVHVKVDTGMHRVGAAVGDVTGILAAIDADPALSADGLWTHLAVADGISDGDRAFTESQLDRFDDLLAALATDGRRPAIIHAANSAGTIACPRARYDLVRCGIALYGHLPAPGMDQAVGATLRPALALRAHVTAVRELDAGERPSYGRHRPLPRRSVVATVPIGYADGVPRALFAAGYEVLIGGRRCPLAGMVTMDQIVVDCGPDATVVPGDEVTLLGRQGDEQITVAEWAAMLGTIGYEVLTGIGPRVPRVVVGDTEDDQVERKAGGTGS